MRMHVVLAVFKRNVASYFSGMLGYLFIIVFVVAGAFLAFDHQFFANNLANLDRLSERFPLLLLFIVPAITMTAWADEKKLGTDELLFTLPARDIEILLGKYLAVLAVYTVALAFSFTHALVLAWLGNPDRGLILTTYAGYWLAGAALLSAGMFASVLTSSATVAFVLGAAICAIPVFIDEVPGLDRFLRDSLGITEPLSVAGHLRGFTSGKVTYSGVFYFVGLAAFFLYLNAVMIARRHWSGGKKQAGMAGQFVIRTACLAIALLCLTYSLSVQGGSVDTTSESLHSLSPTTIETINRIPDDKPVTIQAFLSTDVPRDFMPIRKDLANKLREYSDRAGRKLQVRIVNVESFSPAAEEAEALGIVPRQIQSEEDGRFTQTDVYLGAVLSSGFDSVVIPFFDRGTPIEYELTRSIGTVSKEVRRKVGILGTDVKPMGGFDSQSFRQIPKWMIVQELEKQYDVTEVSPDGDYPEDLDVLIAILPSSLTQPQMDRLVEYASAGKPLLVFDDPAPIWGGPTTPGISWAPLSPKPSPGGGMMPFQQQQSEPKADNGEATSLMRALGLRWDVRQSLFDTFNPHPRFADALQKELIFLDARQNINSGSQITSGLQELVVFSPGFISGQTDDVDVTWLLKSRDDTSGVNRWEDITGSGLFGRQYTFSGPHNVSGDTYIIAARVQGKSDDKRVNAIFVADLDLVHDYMFQVWQQQSLDLKLDNVLFVLNCVDALAGDERYIELRKRRPVHRTLTRLEARKQKFELKRSEEISAADAAADAALEEAQARLDKTLEEVSEQVEQGSVDVGAARVRLSQSREAEQRKLDQRKLEIEREKNQRIREVRIETEQELRAIEREIWWRAILIPPLPALFLGLAIVLSRLISERKGIAKDRIREG